MSSFQTIKKVILVGGSGNIGSLLVGPLAAAFDLTLLSRSSSTANLPENVKVIRAAYTLNGLADAFKGQDAVISAVGAGGFADQKVLVDAAVKAGVQRFLPSELSMNSLPAAARELVPVFQPKYEMLQYLKSMESQGLTWTGIGTGPVIDWGLKAGFMDFDLQNNKAKIWDGGKTTFSAITVADLGKAVVNTLRNPEETANRYIFANTITTSQGEVLRALEKSTGQTYEIEHVTTTEEVSAAKKALTAGDFMGALKLVQAMAWGNLPGMNQNFERDEKESVANDILEVQEQSIESIIRDVLASAS